MIHQIKESPPTYVFFFALYSEMTVTSQTSILLLLDANSLTSWINTQLLRKPLIDDKYPALFNYQR